MNRKLRKYLMAAIVLAAVIATVCAAPLTAAASSRTTGAKTKVTLYADFSCGNADNEDLIETKQVTFNGKPDAVDLAELLSEWTGLDFTLNGATIDDGEIFVDWSEDSTLVAGLDDREQSEDFFFYDAESLNWFMMDSLARTLTENLDVETVYYSAEGEPLAWDKGEMTGLTELPLLQPYMGSPFFYAHADVKGFVELEEESDAYSYLCDELEMLWDLNFDIEFYEEDEVDGLNYWNFELTFWNGDYDAYVCDIAVTTDGKVYGPGLESSEPAVIDYPRVTPYGVYNFEGSLEEYASLTIHHGGTLVMEVEDGDELVEINGRFVVYGNLIFMVFEYDGEYEVKYCHIADKNTLLISVGQGFFKEPIVLEDEDDAQAYLETELADLMDVGLVLEFGDADEVEGETWWAFFLAIPDTDGELLFLDYYVVTESGDIYIYDAGEFLAEPIPGWVPVNYIMCDISGSYYYQGDYDGDELYVYMDGTVDFTVTSGDYIEGISVIYGDRFYILFYDEDDSVEVGILTIVDDDTMMIDWEDGYFR